MVSPSSNNPVRICKVLDSTAISEFSYDFSRRTLRVTFIPTDSVWEYTGVYPSDFGRLCVAHQVGTEFNRIIRNRYPARRILPEPFTQRELFADE